MQKKEDALKGVKLFVLDMDGTVYLGDQLIEGALDFIREVDASEDRDFIFFTNNASRVPAVYVEKLHKLGLDVEESCNSWRCLCRIFEGELSGSKSLSQWYSCSGRELEGKRN